MSYQSDTKRSIEAHKRWLGYLQPDGLVVSAAALVDKGHYYQEAQRERQHELIDHLDTHQSYDEDEGTVEITDFKALAIDFLGLPEQEWVAAADLGEAYHIDLKESRETLAPTAALRWPRGKALEAGEPAYQLLIWEFSTEINGKPIDFDTAYEVFENTWSTSATHRMERLLRETGVPIGLLVSGSQLRLVYAPIGENPGSLTFRFADMLSTMGRPILGAFDLLLNRDMLFLGEEAEQLPALLKHSRDMQANVSIELAQQVLDGLYDLVRGTQAANARTHGQLLKHLLATNPNLIYEGQLNVLMRLVFLLFAEDRGLMPNSELYNQHYSVHALFERLRHDAALHHDTMDDRYGAWAQLLALFRMIFDGHRHKAFQLPPRYGYLFDPDRFPFLEGRCTNPETGEEENLDIPLIGDGTIYRLLNGLLFLKGERISYRTLDVEQIGSVYETMMGFALAQADGQTIAIRPQKKHGAAVNLNLDELIALPAKGSGPTRHKRFVEETGRKLTGARLTQFNEATNVDELLAVLQGPTTNSNLIARNATPHLAQPGSLLLQPTDARRKSGSHYTPRKLTEPIVRKAFEPILANLGEKPFPAQILELKVCDPAVGSGAFLVEACRQLGDELVKAWTAHGGKPVIPADEDEVLHARRLVAQRCLYGVDRNPMAADLAKLSLWLSTLAKDHPFTFLDHSIRAGDSLVGLNKKQILAFHWDLKHDSAKQRIFGQDVLEKKIKSALAYRQEILNAGDLVLPEMKAQQLRLAEKEVDKVRQAGDLAVLGFFSGSKPKERQEARDRLLERWLKATDKSGSEESLREGLDLKAEIKHAREAEKIVAPFHWKIEFPEVFERANSGFDLFVGNPPFAGKNTIASSNNDRYPAWLLSTISESHGYADLVAFFFRRTFDLLRTNGTLGLIATKTIREGNTRETGLRAITRANGEIYFAIPRLTWPGEATVVVSIVCISKGLPKVQKVIKNRDVADISAYLLPGRMNESPHKLISNSNSSYLGSIVLGMGFTFDDSAKEGLASTINEMKDLIKSNPKNNDRIFPFIGYSEVANHPSHKNHRYVINFGDLSIQEVEKEWPELLDIVRQKVKPSRKTQKRDVYREKWWQHAEKQKALYAACKGLNRVIVAGAQASAHFTLAFLPAGMVYSSNLSVIAFETNAAFSMLQSRSHEFWAKAFMSTMGDGLAYTNSTCFETFPFPDDWKKKRSNRDIRAEVLRLPSRTDGA